MFKNMIPNAKRLRVIPPFLNEEKNPGPTCKPIEYTNRIRPNSLAKSNTCLLIEK